MLAPRRATPDEPTVLVVDDDLADLSALVALLSRHGLRVLAATDGEAALGLMLRWPMPDLVLLDAEMPGMDGFEVLERLRADAPTAKVPVVLMLPMEAAGACGCGCVGRAQALGAVGCEAKPIDPASLLRRVQDLVGLTLPAAAA